MYASMYASFSILVSITSTPNILLQSLLFCGLYNFKKSGCARSNGSNYYVVNFQACSKFLQLLPFCNLKYSHASFDTSQSSLMVNNAMVYCTSRMATFLKVVAIMFAIACTFALMAQSFNFVNILSSFATFEPCGQKFLLHLCLLVLCFFIQRVTFYAHPLACPPIVMCLLEVANNV